MPFDSFDIASLIGSIAFALSGVMLGVRKELDLMGVFIVAMLTANGGGAVRDVLVNRTPMVLQDIYAFYLVCAVMLVARLLRVSRWDNLERHSLFVISDSIGLVAFAITGALVGLEYDLNFFGVLALAFLTAAGGGIVRDMLVNEAPTLLHSGFYGSVAIITGILLYGFDYFGFLTGYTLIITFAGMLTLRLIAHYRDWHLPRFRA